MGEVVIELTRCHSKVVLLFILLPSFFLRLPPQVVSWTWVGWLRWSAIMHHFRMVPSIAHSTRWA